MKNFNLNKSASRCINLCAAMVIVSSFAACDNFVDIPGPSSELSAEIVFEDVATADAALAYIYTSLQSKVMVTGEVTGVGILMGAYADEFTSYSNYGLPEETFYTNNIQPNDATVASLWADAYNLVYASNAIIEGLAASGNIQTSDRERLQGEALFLRTYIYSYLVQLFGEIPYVTSTDYTINSSLGKLPVADLYTRLIDDLEQAEALLPPDYSGAGRVKPARAAATALLARICLNAGQYDLASDKASAVINNTALYTISEDLDNVFLIDSPGTIWQLMPGAPNMNTLEGQNYILTSAPPAERAITQSLASAFEPGDMRKAHWLGSVTDGTAIWYYPYKYKERVPTPASQEYAVQLRLEEMYLIRAEARTRSGDLISAQQDVNLIRGRAGLEDTSAGDAAGLLSAILQERRVELFSELGHRFFDLKRFGLASVVLSPQKAGWNDFDVNLPLPERELRLNRNLLPQNQGY